LIPTFGARASAWMTVVCEGLQFVTFAVIIHRTGALKVATAGLE
jgi:hypothetical protein